MTRLPGVVKDDHYADGFEAGYLRALDDVVAQIDRVQPRAARAVQIVAMALRQPYDFAQNLRREM